MPVQFRDYYETLGVPKTATEDDIRSAFRKLARKYHPDVAADKKTAEEKFKEINEAHEVLSDPTKRRKYDELGADWQNGGASRGPPGAAHARAARGGQDFNFGGSTGFSDFFEQFFGGGGRGRSPGFEEMFRGSTGGAQAGGQYRMPGSDIEGDILVTLEESLHGAS